MNDPIASGLDAHKEAEELLPWYTTGQLDTAEQVLVERHLSGCAECRRQLGFDRRLIDEFAVLTPEVDTGWARLRRRLEPRRSWWHRVGNEASATWRTLARRSVAALAFAQLLFVVVAGATLLSLSRPAYRALASAPPPQQANVIAMFQPDTTESQIRNLLQGNGASLVGGPTPADAYLLRVPPQSRPAVLRHLRSDSHVLMAQPIDGSMS
jgi:anti-sigma factor RsiW